MTFEQKLYTLRTENHLSQEKLAEVLNVSRQAVAKWESGQSSPDLNKLIRLGNYFKVSLDRLLKEGEYDESFFGRNKSSGTYEDISGFLIKAKKSTYAAKGAEVASSRPESHDLQYCEGDLLYIDTYLGGEHFSGEEAVWSKGSPLWAMNYTGRVLDDQFSGDFLKEVLLHVPEEKPFRGPLLYQSGDYIYHCEVSGNFDWFNGREDIFCRNRKVYECLFHGGKVK